MGKMYHYYPIHFAVAKGDTSSLKELLEMGLNANMRHRLLGTPLDLVHHMYGSRETVMRDILIEYGGRLSRRK